MRLEQYQIIKIPTPDLQRLRIELLAQRSANGYKAYSKMERARLAAIYAELWRRGVYGGTK